MCQNWWHRSPAKAKQYETVTSCADSWATMLCQAGGRGRPIFRHCRDCPAHYPRYRGPRFRARLPCPIPATGGNIEIDNCDEFEFKVGLDTAKESGRGTEASFLFFGYPRFMSNQNRDIPKRERGSLYTTSRETGVWVQLQPDQLALDAWIEECIYSADPPPKQLPKFYRPRFRKPL